MVTQNLLKCASTKAKTSDRRKNNMKKKTNVKITFANEIKNSIKIHTTSEMKFVEISDKM